MELRPYQVEAVRAVEGEWNEGRKKTLLVLPTGTGKTIVFSEITKNAVNKGDRVLILAHRGELLEQAADKLQKSTGLCAALEKADSHASGSWLRVTVGSVQTMMRESRLKEYTPDDFQTIIIDEAHHAASESYQHVLDYFPESNVLGVTATADRSDKKDLGKVFDSLAYEYSLVDAIKNGYLCPIKAQTIPLKIDLSKVRMSAGDYQAGDLGDALEPYLEKIAEEMAAYCKDRKTVVFLPLVSTSKKFRDILSRHGFRAAEVNGNSPDRAEVLKDFEQGKYNVLCNAMLLIEGWDCPSVDCVVILRPTKSRSLYCQAVGRGTRLSEGKKDLLLLDFLWLSERHELCRPAHLLAKDADIAERMTKLIAEDGGPIDIEEAEQQAEQDVVADRERALAEQLAVMRTRKRKLVDPLQFEFSIQAEDLANYVPSFGWELEPPTEAQKKALEKYGIFPDEIETRGKASQILDRLAKRRDAHLATPKQIRYLESRGFQHVGTWLIDEASAMMTRLVKCNWRIPAGIDVRTYKPASAFESKPISPYHHDDPEWHHAWNVISGVFSYQGNKKEFSNYEGFLELCKKRQPEVMKYKDAENICRLRYEKG